jgi:acyl-coenzyme A thioesterase PaaI-like protein
VTDEGNAFQGFHRRHAPPSADDLRRAARADEVRREIESLVTVPGASFLDRSPVIGAANPLAVPMRVTAIVDGDGVPHVTGEATFGAAYEGPPGCVHGGVIAAYFDEVLGVAQSMTGNPGMTVNLSVDYVSPTPLGRELTFRGTVTGVEGRKIRTSGTLHHGEVLCARATGLFVSMRPEVFERLLRMREDG